MEIFGCDGCVTSFEKAVSFCKHNMVIWSFRLLLRAVCELFWKSKLWMEKCAKGIEKNCNNDSSRSKSPHQNNYLSKSKNVSHKMTKSRLCRSSREKMSLSWFMFSKQKHSKAVPFCLFGILCFECVCSQFYVLQIYSVLQVVEYEWEKSYWVLEIVVIECILSESNEKRFSLVHVDFCFA